MLFPGEEIPDRIFQPGEGMVLADGMGIEEVKYPLIKDVADWKDHIVAILQRNGGAHADAWAGEAACGLVLPASCKQRTKNTKTAKIKALWNYYFVHIKWTKKQNKINYSNFQNALRVITDSDPRLAKYLEERNEKDNK